MFIELPDIIARQRASERSLYMRSSPERRARILRDLERSANQAHERALALALEEVTDFYGAPPPGKYRNARGDQFVVYPSGWRATLQREAPPVPNYVWVPELRYCAPLDAGPKYRFFRGDWWPASPAAPRPIAPVAAIEQHPQHHTPAALEGARFFGQLPPMPQHFLPGGWQQQPPIPAPAAYGGQQVNLAAAAVPQQQPFPFPATPQQQPPAAFGPSEEAFGESLRSALQQEIERLDAEAS